MVKALVEVVRVCYTRRRKVRGEQVTSYVIFETLPDGREAFSERESFEIIWYTFTPSAAERSAAQQLRDNGRGGQQDPYEVIDMGESPD